VPWALPTPPVWTRREKIRRKIEREERQREKPAPGTKPLRFKAACFAAMEDAYNKASSNGAFPVLSQQVFYQARPKMLELMKRNALTADERGKFCYTYLPEFMQAHPELTARWRILYKARGELIEPHTYRRIGLGTTEVANYRKFWANGAVPGCGFDMPVWEIETHGPHRRYGGVVIVEKGGVADLCRAQEIDLRHEDARKHGAMLASSSAAPPRRRSRSSGPAGAS
jgi:hypothetical protein